jgi:hypothetical protein
VHCVGWGNGHKYEEIGGPASWLGYPCSGEIEARSSPSQPRCTIQEFEGGAIFYKEEHGSIPVPQATLEFIASHDGLQERLGFPVRNETPPPAVSAAHLNPAIATADREQFFEHGVVTVRDGVMEAWLRATA